MDETAAALKIETYSYLTRLGALHDRDFNSEINW